MHAVERARDRDEPALAADLGDRLLQPHSARGSSPDEQADHLALIGGHDLFADDDLDPPPPYGIKVIVGEEVMTADQGEVIGLFIEEKIPRGMTLAETITEIRRQGGLVYVPHPFDRMHAVPDYEHMLAVVERHRRDRGLQPADRAARVQRGGGPFAGKYRIIGGAGSDSHVAQGLGSVRIRMRDFDGPEEFLESLRDADMSAKPSSPRYTQVQA